MQNAGHFTGWQRGKRKGMGFGFNQPWEATLASLLSKLLKVLPHLLELPCPVE